MVLRDEPQARDGDRQESCNVYNDAPEWQAKSLGWRSRELVEVCLLEGCVREWRECQVQGEVTASQ